MRTLITLLFALLLIPPIPTRADVLRPPSIAIGAPVPGSTPTDGLNIGTGSILSQFAYGTGNFAALLVPQGTNGSPVLGFVSSTLNDVSIGGGLTLDTGGLNSAIGTGALNSSTTGAYNAAIGYYSLYYNTTGYNNMALGGFSLYHNITGYENTSAGEFSLSFNQSGFQHTGLGSYALTNVGQPQNVTSLANGIAYTVATIGTTTTLAPCGGSASPAVGQVFTANATPCTGTATASANATNNTGIGFQSGLGIVYGSGNTIIGANIVGLPAGLTNAIAIGTGDGTIRSDFGITTSGIWSIPYSVQSTGTVPTISASGGTCAVSAATGGITVGRFTTTAICAATNTITFTWATPTKTGWVCDLTNRTTRTSIQAQSSDSTTTAVFTIGTVSTTNADTIQYHCEGY